MGRLGRRSVSKGNAVRLMRGSRIDLAWQQDASSHLVKQLMVIWREAPQLTPNDAQGSKTFRPSFLLAAGVNY
jgi:hypothetical protein